MAVRSFDGDDDRILTSIGNLSAMTHGTFAALIKRGVTGEFHDMIALLDSGESLIVNFLVDSDDALASWNQTAAEYSQGSMDPTTGWALVVMRKATGTSAPRFSVYVFATDTWTHADGGAGATYTNWATPGAGFTDVSFAGGSEFFQGLMAVRGAWANSIPWANDGALEAAGLESSLQNWIDASPDALWAFNQEATTTAVEDLIGSADQTSLVGTTVVTDDDPPGFTFTAAPVDLEGDIASAGDLAGSLIRVRDLAGGVAGDGALAGDLSRLVPLVGAVEGDSSLSATMVRIRNLAGGVAGVSELTGVITGFDPLPIVARQRARFFRFDGRLALVPVGRGVKTGYGRLEGWSEVSSVFLMDGGSGEASHEQAMLSVASAWATHAGSAAATLSAAIDAALQDAGFRDPVGGDLT